MAMRASTDLKEAHSGEIFLEHKRKKKWADEKTGHSCFMLYARSLYITWGNKEHWIWNCFKETSEENIEVAKLSHVCWLDVRGKLNMSELSPKVVYEIVYLVKLTNGASGWELPIVLKLSLPDGRTQERQLSLSEKPRKQWIELNVGNFQTENGGSGEVCFDIYQHGGHWKNGLIIKGAVVRPKQTTTR
ncbi:protein PHLOEM PROTEIN 2-LIKE A1-like [Alnus glutinosa]|uniref:protein PHLOEM PROTEIN 2-LIKE A1-like n=1 Tax=Alnus glutinosa TaxID=3517 RepID=UPI002D76EA2A|nr:protein PHLOEM PROTEIN 2-LIKE A1-like [Alnus glutinosa]